MKQRRRTTAGGQVEREEVRCHTDLLHQILVCLPAKSLMRFKSVSKPWLSLISDSRFCIDHTVRNFGQKHLVSEFFQQSVASYSDPKPEQILRFSLCSHRSLITPTSINCSESLSIIQPCNGLFLCKDIQTKDYLVYNFTTQNYRLLPAPPPGYHPCKAIGLAFDPSKSCHYKVVQFGWLIKARGDEPYTREIHIFSSESGTWKELRVASPGGIFSTGQQVFWNGAFHWINYKNVHIQFEVDHEKFTWNKNSYVSPEKTKVKYFGESDGTLFLFMSHQAGIDDVYTVLEMTQDSKCWDVKCQLDLRPLLPKVPRSYLKKPSTLFGQFSILYVKSKIKDEDLTLVLAIRGKIVSYLVKKVCYNITITRGEVLGKYKKTGFHLYPVSRCLVPTVL